MSRFERNYVKSTTVSDHGVEIAGKAVERFVLISGVFRHDGGQIHGFFDHVIVGATALHVDGDGMEKQLGHATLKVTRLSYS